MLHVTQGHERGIGLEVFLKSYFCLSVSEQQKIILYAAQEEVAATLKSCKLPRPTHLKIVDVKCSKSAPTPSLASLLLALEAIKQEGGVLFTLPTSKDQLDYNGRHHLGYTEFLRAFYRDPDLIMSFKSHQAQIALLSDHVSLSDFVKLMSGNSWPAKLERLILESAKYYGVKNFFIAGINPHAGEGGLLGSEEKALKKFLSTLSQKYPDFNLSGPLPGDTLHLKAGPQNLLIYLFHDQGLAYFKGVHGFLGANITLGLPFIRLSVDHGTAFDLYGKNEADYRGSLFSLQEGLARL